MSTFPLEIVPNSMSMAFISNTALGVSGLINSAQTLDRGGAKWRAILQYSNMTTDDRAVLLGMIAKLRGQSNRVRIRGWDNPSRGGYGGTPLVNGGSQTGNTLNVDGVTNKTNWIREGDYFSVDVNGEHELKMCIADANSTGGTIAITFEPPLRASPLNNAAIYVDDGGSLPQGVFLFENVVNGWSSKPGKNSKLSDITLVLIEDVFATQ